MRMTVAGCAFFLLALVPCLRQRHRRSTLPGMRVPPRTSAAITSTPGPLQVTTTCCHRSSSPQDRRPTLSRRHPASSTSSPSAPSWLTVRRAAGPVRSSAAFPPSTQPANASGTVGTAITAVQLGGNDPDGGTLAYSAAGLPSGLSLNTATGRITGTPTTAGSFTVVAGVTDDIAPVQQRSFAWTIAPGAATITAAATSPATGTGTAQTFTLTYTDSVGRCADLVTASVVFDAAQSANPANSCAVTVSPRTGLVSLLNDAGTSWASGTIGDQTTLQNSQCSLALANSSVTPSGNNLTVNLAMAFSPVFAGGKNTYLYAAGAGGQNSGWVARGNWTVPAAVLTAVSASPSTGSGTSQSFSLQYSDTAGATDIKTTWAWFATSASASSANSCLMYYERSSDSVYLLNDAGTVWASARRGASTTLQNAQCSIAARTVTATASGNLLTVAFPVTFGAAYLGAKNIFMYALGSASNTGWQDRGDWTIPAAAPPPPVTEVTVDSVTPASGGGASVTFTGQYTDTLGVTDMTASWLWVAPSLSSPSANSCMAYLRAGHRYRATAERCRDCLVLGVARKRNVAAECPVLDRRRRRHENGNRKSSDVEPAAHLLRKLCGGEECVSVWCGSDPEQRMAGSWRLDDPCICSTARGHGNGQIQATPECRNRNGKTSALQYTDTLGVTDLAAASIWIAPTLSSSSANSCLAYHEPATDSVKLLRTTPERCGCRLRVAAQRRCRMPSARLRSVASRSRPQGTYSH